MSIGSLPLVPARASAADHRGAHREPAPPSLALTTSLSARLVKLSMWMGLSEAQQRVCDVLAALLRR
jgi:hypothetical protein